MKTNLNSLYLELLKSTSNTKIALLSDVKTDIKIDKRGKFNYFYIPFFNIKGIEMFILNLDNNSFYTVIPYFSKYGKVEDPHIILSKQILITHYSNPKIIYDFIGAQLGIAIDDFGLSLPKLHYSHYLIFKYKKIVLEISNQKGGFNFALFF